jgi:hypothetical protein
MRKLILIFSIVMACVGHAMAQNYPLCEDYIRKYKPDEVEKFQNRPLWGVHKICFKVMDEHNKPVKISNLSLRCFPCDDLDAFFEWNIPKNGVFNQEFIPLGVDSFYVQIYAQGPNSKFRSSKKMLVTAKERKGEYIDLGTICLKLTSSLESSSLSISQGKSKTFTIESENIQNQINNASFRGIMGLKCKVVDEKGNVVSCPAFYQILPRNNTLLGPYVGDEKGIYNSAFRIYSKEDSLYVEFHHPYMQTKRVMINKDTPLFKYPMDAGGGRTVFLKGIDLGVVQMRYK